jgi:putative DNA primase/helicase
MATAQTNTPDLFNITLSRPVSVLDLYSYADFLVDDYYDRLSRGAQVEEIKERNRLMFGITDDGDDVTTWEEVGINGLEHFNSSDVVNCELLAVDGKWNKKYKFELIGDKEKRIIKLTDKGIETPHLETVANEVLSELPVLIKERLATAGYYRCINPPKHYKQAVNDWLDKTAGNVNMARNTIDAMSAARLDMQIASSEIDHDKYWHLYPCDSGIIDAETGKMMTHEQAYEQGIYLRRRLAVDHVGDASQAVTFHKWLAWAFKDDQELIDYMQIVLGSPMVSRNRDQVGFMWVSPGRNGKTLLMNVIRALAGSTHATDVSSGLFMEKGKNHDGNAANKQVIDMQGARWISSDESGDGKNMDVTTYKQITGGSAVRARISHGDWEDAKSVKGVLTMATNDPPGVRRADAAMRERMIFIPFERKPDERDSSWNPEKDIIENELPHVLAWLLEGAAKYMQAVNSGIARPLSTQGIKRPAKVIAEGERYWNEQDILGQFVAYARESLWTFDETSETTVQNIRTSYIEWRVNAKDMDREMANNVRTRGFTEDLSRALEYAGIKHSTGKTAQAKPTIIGIKTRPDYMRG